VQGELDKGCTIEKEWRPRYPAPRQICESTPSSLALARLES